MEVDAGNLEVADDALAHEGRHAGAGVTLPPALCNPYCKSASPPDRMFTKKNDYYYYDTEQMLLY
jgi:hypothetical protein